MVPREIKKADKRPVKNGGKRNRAVRVISITSGKGGVGKTNIAANMSYILSKMGKKVLLVDADAGLANVDVVLGITSEYNLHHVLNGEKRLPDVIVEGPGGFKILPAASGIQSMAELSKGQKLTLLEELNDLDEDLDFVLIDTAAGIAGNVMYFNMAAKEIIVVVTPDPTSLTDAYALIKVMYQNYAVKRFMILANMVEGSQEAEKIYIRLSNAADHFLNISVDYLGHICSDRKVRAAVRKQSLLVEMYPDSKASEGLFEVTQGLYQRHPEDAASGTIRFFGGATVDNND
ncbi:MAG: MinD/ParA family protein [Syntrophales bacterium]|nr:MinD/ParA family protein [Syntrophales bacterium]